MIDAEKGREIAVLFVDHRIEEIKYFGDPNKDILIHAYSDDKAIDYIKPDEWEVLNNNTSNQIIDVIEARAARFEKQTIDQARGERA